MVIEKSGFTKRRIKIKDVKVNNIVYGSLRTSSNEPIAVIKKIKHSNGLISLYGEYNWSKKNASPDTTIEALHFNNKIVNFKL
jgi:hypothetical protein